MVHNTNHVNLYIYIYPTNATKEQMAQKNKSTKTLAAILSDLLHKTEIANN